MEESKLHIEPEQQGSSTVIRLKGVIDASNMGEFQSIMEEICRKESPLVIVDCRELAYLNSSGFGLLFHFHRLCESWNGDFRLCRIPHKIESIIHVLGLHSILNIQPSLEEALARQSDSSRRQSP